MCKFYKKYIFLPTIMLGVLFISSCGTPQNAVYFSNLDSVKFIQLSKAEFKEPLIQSDDILTINIQTLGQDAFASSQSSETLSGGSPQGGTVNGFLVNKSGSVEMPMLGVIKLDGLTTSEAIEVIRTKAAKYYKDPTVQVRFANFKITVLGEVTKPASYTVPNERVTIFDAISMAGDLTIYGKRGNVMLMRDNQDKKDIVRLDLNSSGLIASPYFYLRQNDVLYVEPTKAKVAVNNAPRTQLITIGIAVVSLLVTIISRF